jgi:dTDP-4-amino-4,6-dideoxygalactose transaminase
MKYIPLLDLHAACAEVRLELNSVIRRVLDSGQFILGPEVRLFECEYAEFTQARHAVGVGSGLDALKLSLEALDIGPGDEVIVPANTYIASWLAVSAVGAVPVPVEPTPGRWTMDPARLGAALTPRTAAVMPVHLYGQPADLDPILDFASAHALRVVEDAAQCHGARYKGRRIGAHGDVVAWSFYPSKNLGGLGDGGAVTTDDPELADRIRVLRNYGSRTRYDNEVRGHNSRLDTLQAAILRVKLRYLDEWNSRRAAVADLYRKNLKGVGLPGVFDDTLPVYHQFVVDHPERDAFQARLMEAGVETFVHYPVPPHLSGAYADFGWELGSFPITEAACQTHLSLPMGPHLSNENAERVVEVVVGAYEA